MSEPASEKMFQTSPLPRQPQVPRQRRDARALYQIPARLCASAGGLRPGGRPDDVMSDLSAARTATRSGQCRESRARRTHEFARSAGRAARQEPTTPDCQTQRYADIQRTAKLSFNLSKFRLLWQTTNPDRTPDSASTSWTDSPAYQGLIARPQENHSLYLPQISSDA